MAISHWTTPLRRPREWVTRSAGFNCGGNYQNRSPSTCLLVDSLGTWVANLLEQDDTSWRRDGAKSTLEFGAGCWEVILVAEETGWGVVPAYPIGRTFRDRLGNLVRRLGATADLVYLVAVMPSTSALSAPLAFVQTPAWDNSFAAVVVPHRSGNHKPSLYWGNGTASWSRSFNPDHFQEQRGLKWVIISRFAWAVRLLAPPSSRWSASAQQVWVLVKKVASWISTLILGKGHAVTINCVSTVSNFATHFYRPT